MDRRLYPDKTLYPFMGADPFRTDLDMDEIVALEKKIKSLDGNDGLTWGEAHKILYFLVAATRSYFQRDLQEEQQFANFIHDEKDINKNMLLGTCLDATIITRILGFRMGLDVRSYHTGDLTRDSGDTIPHAFCVAHIPIKINAGECRPFQFLIDATYRQFFADYRYKNQDNPYSPDGRKLKEPVSNKENPLSFGARMTERWADIVMSDHILKYGFAFLGHSLGQRYLANFLWDKKDWERKNICPEAFLNREIMLEKLRLHLPRVYQSLIETPLEIQQSTGKTPHLDDICTVFPSSPEEKSPKGPQPV